MNHRSKALTETARDRPCTLRVPDVCNHNPQTTVWAHSNEARHGKGRSLKAHDLFGCFACSDCHAWLDQGGATREEKREAFQRAHDETMLTLWLEGAVGVRTERPKREKPYRSPSKIFPRTGFV